jgi:exosortase
VIGERSQAASPRDQENPLNWTWRSVIALVILTNLLGWLYQPVLVGLARQWWDEADYSHGFLVPLLSAYFVWERRERLRALAPNPSAWGLVLLVAGAGLLLLGHVAAELFTMRVSLLVILAGLVLYLRGREHLRMLAFPIFFLIFMIPPPAIVFNAITFPLQLFAARTAAASLELLAVPVLREGNLITLAHTTLEVAEACSGIRSLVTLLALATAYASFTQPDYWRRIVLVLSSIPVAVLTNAARVVGTGVLAHFFGAGIAQDFFHTFSGWFVFVVAFALLFGEGIILGALGGRGRAAVSWRRSQEA